MDRIEDGLYVGDVQDAGSPDRLCDHGVTVVLKLAHADPAEPYPQSVTVVAVPMIDGPQNEYAQFAQAVDELLAALEAEETVFTHCSLGASRSVTVVATALAVRDDRSLPAALEHVAERRPVANPHEALIRRADRYLSERADHDRD